MQNLRCSYSSHESVGKKYRYHFIVTPSGKIEISEWIKKVEESAIENGEKYILDKLYEYCCNELAWLKMKEFKIREDIDDLEEDEAEKWLRELEAKKEKFAIKLERDRRKMASEYYAMRLWEDPEWVEYKFFNELYIQGELQLSMI